MSPESSPATAESASAANANKMMQVLKRAGPVFLKRAKIEVRYEKDGVTEWVKPIHYLDRAGPMARLMIDDFTEMKLTDEEYQETLENMQIILGNYMGLECNDQGEWVERSEPVQ